MAVDKFFSLGVLTFTTHHKQLCAVCYVLYSSHTNAKNFEMLQHHMHLLVYGLVKIDLDQLTFMKKEFSRVL